jgi:hypothetical protein
MTKEPKINQKPPPCRLDPVQALLAFGIWLLSFSALAQTTPLTIFERNLSQERRVALVIGNSAYQHTSKLPNPGKDAAAIGDELTKLGFEVLRHTDLDQIRMTRAIRSFGDKLRGADVGLVFYAGHGIQVSGKNYLVPIDAKLAEERDLRFEAIDIELVLEQLQGAAKIGLVFLDACRDNPLSRTLSRTLGARAGSVGTGLAPVQTGSGALIAYATQPGNVAEDGRSDNSPFTVALLRHLSTPGLESRQMMTRVRAEVRQLTNGRQIPWDHSSLERDFYFAGPALETAKPAVPNIPPQTAAPQVSGNQQFEIIFWQSIQSSQNKADFDAYIAQFPTGGFVSLARNRITQLSSPAPTIVASAAEPRAPAIPDQISTIPKPNVRRDDEWTGAERADAQRNLTALGFYRSSTDGVFGPTTRTAIRQFQAFEGIQETGSLDEDQGKRLFSLAGRTANLLLRGERSPRGVPSASVADQEDRYARGWAAETGEDAKAKDPLEALYWYGLAAQGGHGPAALQLGLLLARGQGVDGPDVEGAILAWKVAAARDQASALFNLGALHERGVGGPNDREEARRWYQLAAARQHAKSAQALQRLAR